MITSKFFKALSTLLLGLSVVACSSSPTEAEYAIHYPIGPVDDDQPRGHYQRLSDEHRRLGNHEIANTYQAKANEQRDYHHDYTAFDLFIDIVLDETTKD